MSFAEFEAVTTLNETTQRELLWQGDPVERVWAAWALGLRLGAAAIPELLACLHASPSPGTRRHLIVILAGLGERSILQVLTEDDPDEFVRATAYEYLVRTAAPGDEQMVRVVAERLLRDPSPEVRQTILRLAQAGKPALSLGQVAPLVYDPDLEARELAVDVLLRAATLSELFAGVLEDRVRLEPDPALRRRLAELCLAAGGAERLLHLARGLPNSGRIDLLHLLAQRGHRFTWDELGSLSTLRDPEIDTALIQLLNPGDAPQAFGWLLFCVVRALHRPSPRTRPEAEVYRLVSECAERAEELLHPVAPRISLVQLDESERRMIRAIVAHLTEYRRQVEEQRLEDEALGEETGWYQDKLIQDRLRLLTELRRLASPEV